LAVVEVDEAAEVEDVLERQALRRELLVTLFD
jgi:hypothetical protein